jgi:DNA-binding winged helix-turn-helix (wHTH) protein/TolB-like protein/Flp pilus assembly protein TadD
MSRESNELREFGCFRLDVSNRVLTARGEPVDLPLKEIELLCLLTQRPGETLEKDHLIAGIWGDEVVEESNLSRYVYRLRRTFVHFGLSADLIKTVPRRGYRFTGSVARRDLERFVVERHSVSRTTIEEVDSAHRASGWFSQPWARLGFGLVIPAIVLIAALALNWASIGGAANGINSMAVLPLVSASSDPEDQILGLGVADSLVAQVGRVAGLRLVSVKSVNNDIADADPAELGRRLNVDCVLVGLVQRSGNEMRISLRLVRSSDGLQLWTTNVREDANLIFTVQDELAASIATAIARTLNPPGRPHATQNREAYEAYLRGRFFLDKRSREAFESARNEFEKAIELDAGFSLAYSGLADTLALQANIEKGESRARTYARAKEMANKAIEADPTSAAAYTSLGWIQRTHEWDWRQAERSFLRAIEFDPNYASARQWYALLLTNLGRHDEAVHQMAKARELEPLSRSILLNTFAVEQYRGALDGLADLAQAANTLEPHESTNSRLVSIGHLRLGEYQQVISTVEREIRANEGRLGGSYSAACLAIAYHRTGQNEDYLRVLKMLKDRSVKDSEALYRLALVYAAVGNADEAIANLEKCLEVRDDRMIWIKVEPEFRDLRTDPRFVRLTEQMRFS